MPPVESSKRTDHGLSVRQVTNAPLCGKDGPVIEDVVNGSWDSYWFTSVAGSLAVTQPDLLRKAWDENAKKGESVDKTVFHLYDYKGERQDIESERGKVSEEADFNSERENWWLAGSEMALTRMGGYLGADKDKLAWGSPVDAFKILTNKTAVIKQVGDDAQQFWDVIKRSTSSTPVIFGLGADPDDVWDLKPWRWYTVVGHLDGDRNQVKKEYDNKM
ncbi:hypothetical protein IAT40_007600 [Kwoniella sp. CBS 6097]